MHCRAFLAFALVVPLAGCSSLTQPEEILIAPEPPKPPPVAAAAAGAAAPVVAGPDGAARPARPMGRAAPSEGG